MSKTVAYITRHAVANYGSALQAYATQTALENLGCNPICINYIREDELAKNISKTRLNMSRWNKNPFTKAVYLVTQKLVFDYAGKKFSSYIKNIIKVTEKEYNSLSDLENNLPKADVYMTGSDQVWNTITYGKIDGAYFLSFVPDEKKKIAYGASFGGKTVKEEDKNNIKRWLNKYDSISIRENSGVKIVEEMGINSQQVLDPTFLIEKKDWLKIVPDKKSKENYVFVYQLHPNKEFEKYAKEFAKRKGLKLYRVNAYFHHFIKPGKFICCPPIEEFLWYIKNASFFLTDSFHGTAFAIGLNTQFVDILPNKYSERNRSILQLTGLENRILDSYNDFTIADKPIDFDSVNSIIADERKKSLAVLKNMIED